VSLCFAGQKKEAEERNVQADQERAANHETPGESNLEPARDCMKLLKIDMVMHSIGCGYLQHGPVNQRMCL
jgi:hypothetical protein